MKANQFSNPRVRDLAWIISSESLMTFHASDSSATPLSFWNQPLDNATYKWLEKLNNSPAKLDDFIASEKESLTGKLFEAYLKFFFTEHMDFDLIASNIQLIEENRTKGEIDFIVFDRRASETLHIEAACKFYLSSSNKSAWESWIGPNSIDSLDKKMATLNRQIDNINLPSAKGFLSSQGISIDRSLCLMKGYFFHHIQKIQTHKSPKHCSQNYPSGLWIRLSEIDYFDLHQPVWYLLAKDRWFSPLQSVQKGSSITQLLPKMRKMLNVLKRPVLLARLQDGENEDLRLFVVNNEWPH